MKSILLISVLLFSAIATANGTAIYEKLGGDNAIAGQCEKNSLKALEQASHNLAIISSKLEPSYSADELAVAKAEYDRLTTEDVTVTLVAAPINEFAVLKIDVNCRTAAVMATLNTFVDIAETLNPEIVSLQINQDNATNPVASITLEEMFVPTSRSDFVQSSNFVLTIDSNQQLGLAAGSTYIRLQQNAYVFPMDAHSRLASLQALIGIPSK